MMTSETKKTLVETFRRAVDLEKRFGHRLDVPELPNKWHEVGELIEKMIVDLIKEHACQKKQKITRA